MEVRTRFAPSPTGYLHIGGVRTALFNWLLARRHGGQFILRIDDTDAARHVEEAVQIILDGLRWLGLNWDEGPQVGGPHAPYFQSQRHGQYERAIETLLAAGWAYPALETAEELETARQAARAAGKPFVHRGPHRDLPPDECLALYREQRPAVRFKVPPGQTTVLEDHIRGRVEWQTDLLGDFTIARGGGQALYNLASIQDDLAMGITHILRAEEHLSNTHPQILIARGLGAERLPQFAHLPYVAAPGGKQKLSKRNPPPGVMVGLEEYQRAGYLPQAILNALARLGWSRDDKTEIMPLAEIIEHFSLDRVNPAPASLDPDKLAWIQAHYMQALPPEDRIRGMVPFLVEAGLLAAPISSEQFATLAAIDAACGDRLKVLADVVRYGGFFLQAESSYDDKARKTLREERATELLDMLRAALAPLEPFTVPAIEAVVTAVRTQSAAGGQINRLLRAAVTGQSVGPGIFECLAILGKPRSLDRLARAIRIGRE